MFVARHLAESTLFCLMLTGMAALLSRRASTRYGVMLMGTAKFAIPSVLLSEVGARLASAWPATAWLAMLADGIGSFWRAVWQMCFGALPAILEHDGAPFSSAVMAVWAAGALMLLGLWLTQARAACDSAMAATSEERAAFRRACARAGVQRAVVVRAKNREASPALRGWWRPTVVIPPDLSRELTASELEAVLLHELAHAQRWDNLAAVFVHALTCLIWFHPLLWLWERRLGVERERACDQRVLAYGAAPETYAAAILKACRFAVVQTADFPAGISGMAGSDLNRRIQLILAHRSLPSLPRRLYVPRLLAIGLAAMMPALPIAGGYCEQCVSHPAAQHPIPLIHKRSFR